MYSGMLFATFCWHVEDLYMSSVNYMHCGAPKTWYTIPGEYKEQYDNYFKKKYADLLKKSRTLLSDIVVTINPVELIENNIPVFRTEQYPNEFIVTFPKAYHSGFSHGWNVSEAVNVADPSWISYATEAQSSYASEGFMKKQSFPYDWLIFENILNMGMLDFSDKAKQQLMTEFNQIKMREMKNRDFVTDCYEKACLAKFENATTRYDAHVCTVCQNYCYLSYLSCGSCKKLGCTHHVTICGCLNNKIYLNLRFTEKEMNEFGKEFKKMLKL
jgi:histone demethylase JARID1